MRRSAGAGYRRPAESNSAGLRPFAGGAGYWLASRNYLRAALARAPHNPRIREALAAGFHRTRPTLASLLGLGGDQAGQDAAGLLLSMFHGLLYQVLLDPALAIEGGRMHRAQARLRSALPDYPE